MAVGEQVDRLGMRASVGEVLADVGGAFPLNTTLDLVKDKIQSWDFSDRVKPFLAPHASDTLSTNFAKEIAAFAKESGLPVQMHLSQTHGEKERMLKREGKSPVQWAHECGLVNNQLMAVHLVSADDQDLKILKDNCAHVGLSPISQSIYEELAPIEKFFEYNLNCSLSTDCAASNDSADLWAEARAFQWMFKDRSKRKLENHQLLNLMTKNPYEWLMKPQIGKIAKGQKADLVLHKVRSENLPVFDPLSSVINDMGAKNVEHVMVDGKWALIDKKPVFISESDAKEEFNSALSEMRNLVGNEVELPASLF